MQILTRSALSIVISCIGFASCGISHGASSLKFIPAAGQKTSFELNIHQKISQTIMGQEQNTEQTFTYGCTQTLGEFGPDGTFLIDFIYDWVSVEMMMPDPIGTVTFDSREPKSDLSPIVAGFAAIAGRGFRMRVTPTGEILAVEGMTEMLEAMFAELELPAEAEAMKDAMEKQFNDASMTEFMQPFLSIYPDRDVAVGDTWERRHEVTAFFPHSQENTYELIERSEGRCKLRLESKVTSEEGGAPMDMGAFQLQFSVSGTQSGTITLDGETGMTREASIQGELSGEVQLVGDEAEAWPISLQQEMTLRTVD